MIAWLPNGVGGSLACMVDMPRHGVLIDLQSTQITTSGGGISWYGTNVTHIQQHTRHDMLCFGYIYLSFN
jgi:hypothetical protein